VDSFGNAVTIFISTVLSLFNTNLSQTSALTFANVSTDTELTLQPDIPRSNKERDLMKLRSVGILRPGLLPKYNFCRFGNFKNVSGWR